MVLGLRAYIGTIGILKKKMETTTMALHPKP